MLAALALPIAISSCDNGNDKNDDKGKYDADFEAIAKQYIDNTVNLTYSLLATETQNLYEDLLALKTKMKGGASATQGEIDDICAEFILARSYYEESEAFLFGAATDFGIDPHIDTWPLDLQGLADALSNKTQMANLDAENARAIRLSRNRIRDIQRRKEPRGISVQWPRDKLRIQKRKRERA